MHPVIVSPKWLLLFFGSIRCLKCLKKTFARVCAQLFSGTPAHDAVYAWQAVCRRVHQIGSSLSACAKRRIATAPCEFRFLKMENDSPVFFYLYAWKKDAASWRDVPEEYWRPLPPTQNKRLNKGEKRFFLQRSHYRGAYSRLDYLMMVDEIDLISVSLWDHPRHGQMFVQKRLKPKEENSAQPMKVPMNVKEEKSVKPNEEKLASPKKTVKPKKDKLAEGKKVKKTVLKKA